MIRLKDPNRQIPNGMTFHQPEIPKWKPPQYASIEVITNAVVNLRRANPYLGQKNNWATDENSVRLEVELYNAKVCQAMGWKDYIITDESIAPPKGLPLHRTPGVLGVVAGAKRVASGAKIITAWLGDEGVPVANDLAEKRAEVCATCPKNQKGDWTSYFTRPVAELVRKQIESRNDMGLTTSFDDKLVVCEACGCPLKLKVHTPLKYILPNTTPKELELLDPRCWITKEAA